MHVRLALGSCVGAAAQDTDLLGGHVGRELAKVGGLVQQPA